MSNMSYCRFRNTTTDLRECLDAIERHEELSLEASRAAKHLQNLCERYLNAVECCGIEVDKDDYEEEHEEEEYEDG